MTKPTSKAGKAAEIEVTLYCPFLYCPFCGKASLRGSSGRWYCTNVECDYTCDIAVALMDHLDEKVRHVTGADQTRAHECHWPGCERQVPPAMWGCREHWFALPRKIRDAIWASYVVGQEIDVSPSDMYVDAARAAQDWIRENAHRRAARAKKGRR